MKGSKIMKNNKTNTAANNTNAKTTSNIPPIMGTAATEMGTDVIDLSMDTIRANVLATIAAAAKIDNPAADVDGSSSDRAGNELPPPNLDIDKGYSAANEVDGRVFQFMPKLRFDPDMGLQVDPDLAKDYTDPDEYPDVPQTPVSVVFTTVGQWLSTLYSLPAYQRRDQFDAKFASNLVKSALYHRYIPPITLIEHDNDDGSVSYNLGDGRQRTRSLLFARENIPKYNLPWFDSCPLMVVITRPGLGQTEEEMFVSLNTNNRLSDAQAKRGMYPDDVQAIWTAINESGIIDTLNPTRRREDIVTTSRIARADDIVSTMTLASIDLDNLCTNTAGLSKALQSTDKVDNLDKVIANVKRACSLLAGVLYVLGSYEHKTTVNGKVKVERTYSKILNKVGSCAHMAIMYSVAYYGNPSASEMMELILRLYTLDGNCAHVEPISVKFGKTSRKLEWYGLTDKSTRGNGSKDVVPRVRCALAHLEYVREQAANERQAAVEADVIASADSVPNDL